MMTSQASFKLIIEFVDPDLSLEDRDEQAHRFMAELQDVDEIETVTRVLDPQPPTGNKASGGFLAGLLMAEVNVSNAKAAFGFFKDRLVGKPIELEVEASGKKLKVVTGHRNKRA
jgi:hypothetical protein